MTKGLAPRARAPLRFVLSIADARSRALGVLSAALRWLERIALVVAAYSFVLTRKRDALLYALALAALVTLRAAVTSAARSRAVERLHAATLDALLRGDVLRGSALPHEDAQTVVFDGIHHGGRVLYEVLPDLAGDAAAALMLAAYLAATSPPRVLGVAAVALALAAAAVVLTRRVTSRAQARAWARYRPVIDGVVDGIGARLELVASGGEGAYMARFEARLRAWREVAARSEALAALAGRAPMVAAALGVGAALLIDQSLRGALTSAAIADAAVFASVVPAFAGLARGAHELAKCAAKLAPMRELVDAPPREAPRDGAPVPPLPVRIEWRGVSFAYSRDDGRRGPRVLDEVSIAWSPGELLVVEGANGSGKSTCLRLLLALARPTAGSITVGDRELFELDARAWRRSIAYLPQHPFLPERANVREAVHLVAPEASDAAIRAALERVDVWRALASAGGAEPLDVLVSTLSAGQRQRVALARVLVQNTPIVLLDEPDANLDHAGIELLLGLVRELSRDRMVALVAHSEAVLAAGDRRVALPSV